MANLKDLIVLGVSRFIGNVYGSKFITDGGTSSLFVKGDGTLDSTAYGTYSKPSGGIPKTDLASDVLASLDDKDTIIVDLTFDSLHSTWTNDNINNLIYTSTLTLGELALAANLGKNIIFRVDLSNSVGVKSGGLIAPEIGYYFARTYFYLYEENSQLYDCDLRALYSFSDWRELVDGCYSFDIHPLSTSSLNNTSWKLTLYNIDADYLAPIVSLLSEATSAGWIPGDDIVESIVNHILTVGSNSAYVMLLEVTDAIKKSDIPSSTDNAVVRFDGTDGNMLNSGVTISDNNEVTATRFIGPATKSLSVPIATVDSTSTSTAFTVQVPEFANETELRDGLFFYIFNNKVASASGWTLNVNGLGAKPVFNSSNTRTTTGFGLSRMFPCWYDSTLDSGNGAWVIGYLTDSDNNTIGYDIREYYNGAKKTKTATQRYQLMMSCFDGMLLPVYSGAYTTARGKVLTTLPFNPLGQVYYYINTTNCSAGTAFSASYLLCQSTYNLVDLRYSFNCGTSLVAGDVVYLVCVPQPDGSAVLHSEPLAFALPTTEDGLLYKRLGKCYNTYQIILELSKPVYYYKNGGIMLWTGGTNFFFNLSDFGLNKNIVLRNNNVVANHMKGDAVVWNQILKNNYKKYSNATNNISIVVDGNTCTVTNTNYTGTGNDPISVTVGSDSGVVGHKYLLKYGFQIIIGSNITGPMFEGHINAGVVNTTHIGNTYYYFFTSTREYYLPLFKAAGTKAIGDSWEFSNVQLFDLTLMFGAGNEPSTVDEFENWLIEHVGYQDYYAYNEGSLLSANATGFRYTSANGKAKTHELNITTLTGKMNGEGSSVTIFPDGLKKAGTVYDEIFIDNGVVKAIRRVGSVDLGTLSWTLTNSDKQVYVSSDIINLKTNGGTSSLNAKMLCVKYILAEYGIYAANISDKTMGNRLNSSPQIIIRDTSYSDAASFKTAMSGVTLYYELATPEEYTLDDQSYLPFSFTEEKGGNNVLLPPNGDIPTHISPLTNVRLGGEDEWLEDKIKNTYSKDEVDVKISVKEDKMAIVSASGTTLNAAVNTYYNFASEVGTLDITFPAVTDTTHINNIVFMLTTGSTPVVTFTAPSGINVIAQDGFSIEASTTYEINAIFNGTSWVVAAMKLNTTDIQPSNP